MFDRCFLKYMIENCVLFLVPVVNFGGLLCLNWPELEWRVMGGRFSGWVMSYQELAQAQPG